MAIYIIRRSFQTIAFILFVWLITYTILVLLDPSGPKYQYDNRADIVPGLRQITPETLGQTYKLDKPWPANFFLWLFDPSDTTQLDRSFNTVPKGIDIGFGVLRLKGSGALTGDFGNTERIAPGTSVSEIVSGRFGNTVLLVGISALVAILFAIPLGVSAAARKGSKTDHALTFISFAGFSIPPYTLGIFLIVTLAVIPYLLHTQNGWTWLPYLPPSGSYDLNQEGSIPNRIYHLVLPIAALVLPQTAWLSRHVRFSMLEILKLDYIRTAWAKGLPARMVLFKHALRNALIPFITSVGLIVPVLISGSIMIEAAFGYNGMGQLFFKAFGGCLASPELYESLCRGGGGATPDLPVQLCLILLMSVVVAVSNMLADIFYVVADPRIDPNKKVLA